ncbi:Uncharacterised protein [Mycobacteroides abscessus subsp. abscessus]|nr:Uncharacterised protein [Mycobacteroides abscessus subsp. abscessus]
MFSCPSASWYRERRVSVHRLAGICGSNLSRDSNVGRIESEISGICPHVGSSTIKVIGPVS